MLTSNAWTLNLPVSELLTIPFHMRPGPGCGDCCSGVLNIKHDSNLRMYGWSFLLFLT